MTLDICATASQIEVSPSGIPSIFPLKRTRAMKVYSDQDADLEELLVRLKERKEVVRCEILAG